MSATGSWIDMWHHASWVVRGVLLCLCAMSLGSWALIVQKMRFFKHFNGWMRRFESRFHAGVPWTQLHEQLSHHTQEAVGSSMVFQAGFQEWQRLCKRLLHHPDAIMQGVTRVMQLAVAREEDLMTSHMTWLATIASVAPYVGLLGTVWGIMHTFLALGHSGHQGHLSMVAPGIAEALVATAAGLVAAIPAVVAYNRFVSQVDQGIQRLHMFREAFSVMLHRQVHVQPTREGDT